MTSPTVASVRIAQALHESILRGELKPGERIRQEEIAAEFGASRLPVREALRLLAADGLVTMVANTGAWVAQLNLREATEIYKIRERIEPLALAESMPRLTEADIDQISGLADAIDGVEDTDSFLRLDREFHLATYRRADMPALEAMVLRYWNTTQHYRRAYYELPGSGGHWTIHYEHKLLVDAIRRRDTDEGERILRSHIRRTRLALAEHPEIFPKD
ncbi:MULTISPECIES: GntR family transcriptional regulator [Arthrobacter]|uniref:GntR family transcriptional regulator n=2 Tax=Arthrobacter TaxID=1663 RepID=A0ABU9KJF6_9MICC|nr:GntR family transcriptional regulator [Arthrobacter sp. YJM1]MDP5226727.1 GntR family transcriptional regulator [Arthrobacter sp. YJM1]